MKNHRWVLRTLSLVLCLWSANGFAAEMKEWTFLTFLNGHNNLDSYGEMNVNQMKEVGSNDQLNIVVQWASEAYGNTRRIYVNKGSFDVVEETPAIDMGDANQLVEFVRWAAERYPAKHYFINIWNHGAGWHRVTMNGGGVSAQDISFDDNTGHHITTEQLGQALGQIAGIIGHKVDIYGSDACLMAMAEVAGEMHDSVSYMVGSEETEPGEGWPYSTFLTRWVAAGTPSAADVSKMLSEEYFKAYNGGIYGRKAVTFSAMDLSKLGGLYTAVGNLSRELNKLTSGEMKNVLSVANATQDYTYGDYKDLGDFVARLESNSAVKVDTQALADVKSAVSALVIANYASSQYKGSNGVAMWIPTSKYDWNSYQARYKGLRFDHETSWSSTLARFF